MTERDTEHDLSILANEFFRQLEFIDWGEYGSPSLDCKRPFGNSDVEGDVLELLRLDPEGNDGEDECWSSNQREYARELYVDRLVPYLKKRWFAGARAGR